MKPLIILEMANNHSGSLEHGISIIESYSNICLPYKHQFDFVFKYQYRDLPNFIRKDMAGNMSIPLIKRFSETRLDFSQYEVLIQAARTNGFAAMVTPFDENSVKVACSHNVDYLKVASCSFGDWPLLETIAKAGKPVVASCAGAPLETIDNVVAFFRNRNIFLILQHCVGSYPTSCEDMNVGQVSFLRSRYPLTPIGFSSHEEPHTTDIAPLALALGAQSFEKHVALETENISKNKYSTSPLELQSWLQSLSRAQEIIGVDRERYHPQPSEIQSLRNLQRGVFCSSPIKAGQIISKSDIYFAFPPSENQLTANDLGKYTLVTAKTDLKLDQPITTKEVTLENHQDLIQAIATDVSSLVRDARITFPDYADLEISHHYGVPRFREFGLTMITVVNREYCKKILILLPGQAHPEQYHKKKEETFHVLSGSGLLLLDGSEQKMKPGDVIIIKPGVKHFFSTKDGLILEEISSTHHQDDSYYTDEVINRSRHRKTYLSHWNLHNAATQ